MGENCCACVCSSCFLVAIAGIVLLFVFLPRTPSQEVAITNANLTRFELTSSPTTSLFYNLSFTMSMRGDAGDYHDMEVDCYCSAEQFDSVKLEDFNIKRRRTRLFNLSRSGNSTMNMGSSGDDSFRRSNETGFFALEIWLKGKWLYQTSSYFDASGSYVASHLSFQCKLTLQLITSQNTSTQSNFQVVKCH